MQARSGGGGSRREGLGFWAHIPSFPRLRVLGHLGGLSRTISHTKMILRLLPSSPVGCDTHIPAYLVPLPSVALARGGEGPAEELPLSKWEQQQFVQGPDPHVNYRAEGSSWEGKGSQGSDPSVPPLIAGRP